MSINFTKRLKIWGSKKVENVMPVSESDILASEIKEKENVYDKLKNSYFTAKGELETTKKEIASIDDILAKIDETARSASVANDDLALETLYVEEKNLRKNKEMLEEKRKLQELTADEFFELKNKAKNYITEKKYNLEQLRIKEEYVNQANNYMKIVNSNEFDDITAESEKKIDTDLNVVKFKMKDHEEENKIDDIMNKYSKDEGLEEFKNRYKKTEE